MLFSTTESHSTGRVAAVKYALRLIVLTSAMLMQTNVPAQERHIVARGITMFTLSLGDTYTVRPGVIIEALQDGRARWIGGGGSIVEWDFKDHDVATMDEPYTTIKNFEKPFQSFYAIEVR